MDRASKASESSQSESLGENLKRSHIGRRAFINTVVLGWGAFAVALTALTAIFTRFMYPNVPVEKSLKIEGKRPEEYPVDDVDETHKGDGFWVVRTEASVYALSTTCTHLGCTPNWLATENKFKCPCHGSGFRKTGINFEGPAPRPLERYWIGLADTGKILVDKGKKYQEELGQWEEPHSFLEFQA